MNDGVNIIFEGDDNNPFLVVHKSANLPSAPLTKSDTNNAFFKVSEIFPEIKHIVGKKQIEGGLLHRLDTATEGLLLIAKTQDAYERLSYFQLKGLFLKKYRARCIMLPVENSELVGFPQLPEKYNINVKEPPLLIQSRFRPFGLHRSSVRPVYVGSEFKDNRAALKKASADIYTTVLSECIKKSTNLYELEYELSKGYRHQIRAHSAWLGFPLVGDGLYNTYFRNDEKNGEVTNLQLFAHSISFPHPLTEKTITFSI